MSEKTIDRLALVSAILMGWMWLEASYAVLHLCGRLSGIYNDMFGG